MRVLIIEDEPIAATRLQNMIKQLHPDFEIVDILDTVESSIEWFNVNIHPDLVFLDIELADGLSFHIFENVKTESPVIFTTAFDNYAIRAFELHCIDYLLKPVNIEKLESAILKLEKQKFVFSANNLEKYLSSLITGVNKQTQSYRSRFLISRPDGYIPVNIDEVAYFFSENEQTFIKTYNNKS